MSQENRPNTEDSHQVPMSASVRLIVGWLWVGVPLGWGIWQTVRTSLALFR
jgi:hypothetical protein